MESLTWFSWPLALLGATTLLLAGKGHWWSWLLGVFTEILWVGYALLTHQYGFIFASFLYIAIYLKNSHSWRKEDMEVKEYEVVKQQA